MKKIRRVWRAFCYGFWQAWLEVPPRWAKKNEVTVTLSCDTAQFDQEIDTALLRMQQLAQQAKFIGLN